MDDHGGTMPIAWRSLGLLAGMLIAGPLQPGSLKAQQPVTITGRVTNTRGAPMADVTIVANLDYADGLSTSLRAGLSALPRGIDGALILLGDMPEIETSVLTALVAAFTGENAICVPVRRGRQGNPVLWGSAHFAEMMGLTGDSGAKPLMARHETHLIEVQVATDSIFEDVDAPEDLARFKR
jgi:molybdenum cofactor cytidylyltransferase